MSRDDTSDAWIREALASLDRPQMPDDVAQRLDEALHRAQLSDSEHTAAATIIPQQRAGRQAGSAKRRSWLIGAAGIAAALVAVAVVNPLQLGVGDTPDTTEFAAPQVTGPASEPPYARPAPTPTPTATEVAVAGVLLASQTTYTEQSLPEQVAVVAQIEPVGEGPSQTAALNGQWAAVAQAPAATTRGAAACVAALPPGADDDLLFVDRAEYEDQPVLVVARRSGADIEVFVLGADCTATDTAVVMRATVDSP